jgi:hypothetical protein
MDTGANAGVNSATSLDMFRHMAAKPKKPARGGSQGAPARAQGEPTRVAPLPPMPVPPAGVRPGQPAGPAPQVNYRHRQQAGIDALLAIATPVRPAGEQREEPPLAMPKPSQLQRSGQLLPAGENATLPRAGG